MALGVELADVGYDIAQAAVNQLSFPGGDSFCCLV